MFFRNHLLRALSADDASALRWSMREVVLPTGQMICRRGDMVEAVYFPSTAVLSMVAVIGDERTVETATVGFEGAAGLLAALGEEPISSDIFAQIGGAAISVPANVLRRRAFESPTFMQLALRSAQANYAQCEQSVACMAVHGVRARLARWLLVTDDRIGSDIVPLTQAHLALMMGVQRTTISAAAGELKAAGLVGYIRGQIQIVDRAGLERQACECYQANHAALTRLAGLSQPAQ
ncbi:MAG: transcriptional regulator, Crp/Fnr family [Caulobacteraceae bacterium]|jgi:CRP-like cAMP-binding protein|nr:transcriptional regulator, Crp/Fnr family [Caulobacteraceae bacterium]